MEEEEVSTVGAYGLLYFFVFFGIDFLFLTLALFKYCSLPEFWPDFGVTSKDWMEFWLDFSVLSLFGW